MASDVEDTLVPLNTSGSGVFGADTASVEGDNASKSAVDETKEEILRLRVRGFRLGGEKGTTWQKVVILRAGHRKVAIRDQQSLLGRDKEDSLQIDLDDVKLDLYYIAKCQGPPQCTLRETKDSATYMLEFEALQDVFRFQEIFTGFSVQSHFPDISVRVQPRYQGKISNFFTAVQIWRQIPDRYDSLMHAHDGLHAPSHLPETGAKRDLPGHEGYPAQMNTTTTSDRGLRSVDSSVMNRPPSLFLVFSGLDIGAPVKSSLVKIPLDGNISIAKKDKLHKVKLDIAKTKHQQEPLLNGALALIPALAFTTLNPALGAGLWSAYQVSRFSKFVNSIGQGIKWVVLGFKNIDDEMRFKATFNALKDPHETKAEQVDSSAPRSRPRRDLAGDPTNRPDETAGIIRSVTASPDPKFRPQQGLAGNSTIYSDGRADMVPLVAGSSNFNSKSHGRSRSSDVLHADQQTSSKSPYESSVGEMKRLRSRIMEDTGVKWRTPRIHSSPYAAHIANKESNQVLWLLDEPPHFEASAKAKQIQRQRRICRKLVLFMLWKWELNDGVPKEMWSSPASFEFINVLEISRFDKIKNLFETYSGREWDWWPLDPPAKPLESGKVRIRWQCTCGDQRWTDTSTYLAQKCQAFVNENTAAGHESGDAASQSAGSTASHPHPRSVVSGSFPSDTSQSTGVTSNIHSTAQAGHIQETNKSSHSKNLYVLLCIYQGSQIHHSQILASKCQNDEAFFENLRQDYRRLRGFFRFWFSPLQFSHCDFVKFTRFYVNELAKVGYSLPIDLVYQYNPRPPGPHEDPPISPHEFRRRFYTHFANPCGRDEALERIPKRQKRFQINLHVDGREDMWGLHVELRPSFLVVLMWQIVITAGGWAFMRWWLSRHKGDLQNAAVPVTLIVTAVMTLWAPIRKGMTEAL